MPSSLLIIDDEVSILMAFKKVFRSPEFEIQTAATASEGLEQFQTGRPDVVVLDLHLPDGRGMEVFAKLRELDARTPVILITGHGTTDLAIEAMKQGAYDYLLKPLELSSIRELVTQAAESSRLMHVPAWVQAEVDESEPPPSVGDVLVGKSDGMQQVYKAIGRVAATDATVLILGESGTGKELVARAIYQHSNRAKATFLAINCAAIPETLLESELFGHERGSFSGADRKRIGKFERSAGGTLFLDEIGDMTPLTQAKILRVLQERTFERVGGEEQISTDVRILAATNAPLQERVGQGLFRKDLYFRLNVYAISLPPLRERLEDLPLLVDHFLRRFSRELGKPIPTLAPDFLDVLQQHSWPGNIRELQSILKQAILRMPGPVLRASDVPDAIQLACGTTEADASDSLGWDAWVTELLQSGSEEIYAKSLERMEREVLVRVLKETGGSQRQAARRLGITRGSLRTKLRTLRIAVERHVGDLEDPDGSSDEPLDSTMSHPNPRET